MPSHYLVTGGSGFVGQHLVRRLVARGDRITALVRRTSQRAELERAGARLVVGDIATGEGLREALEGIDCVLHLAGVTKARAADEYHRGNAGGTRRLAEAMAALPTPPRLVYCSSLAAAGPSAVGQPRREEEPPSPVSLYGRSKLGGEQAVRALADRVPSVIVRPPIVYGPADKEFLPSILPMARLGVALKSGFGEKRYSLVHVEDLCDGLLLAARAGRTLSAGEPAAGVYHLSDGGEHAWGDICAALARALGKRGARVIPVPEVVSYAAVLGAWVHGAVRGTVPILSLDKAREMRCEAWICSTERARAELGFQPAYGLDAGFAHAVAWYRERGLI